MSELFIDIDEKELKFWIDFWLTFIMGVLTAGLYHIQEKWKNQIKYRKKSRKVISYICLGNKYIFIILSMYAILLVLFCVVSYKTYEEVYKWTTSFAVGFSIQALKAYYKAIDPIRRCKTFLISFLVLLLIDILYWMIVGGDNPCTALTIGYLVWMISMRIER